MWRLLIKTNLKIGSLPVSTALAAVSTLKFRHVIADFVQPVFKTPLMVHHPTYRSHLVVLTKVRKVYYKDSMGYIKTCFDCIISLVSLFIVLNCDLKKWT